MEARHEFKSGCTGKVPFTSFNKAQQTAKRMRKTHRESHVEPYHCQHCQQFHVGESWSYGRKNPRKEIRE
jgi:hypothetical protein